MPVDTSSVWTLATWAMLALAALVLAVLFVAWRKGRPLPGGEVFRASRLSAGNRLFPTQVVITPTSVVHHTPQWIGTRDHSIHIAHVASVSIDTHLLFSNVYIETTGGTTPIACKGHGKGDAVRMKQLIEQYQTAYYRVAQGTPASEPGSRQAPRQG